MVICRSHFCFCQFQLWYEATMGNQCSLVIWRDGGEHSSDVNQHEEQTSYALEQFLVEPNNTWQNDGTTVSHLTRLHAFWTHGHTLSLRNGLLKKWFPLFLRKHGQACKSLQQNVTWWPPVEGLLYLVSECNSVRGDQIFHSSCFSWWSPTKTHLYFHTPEFCSITWHQNL